MNGIALIISGADFSANNIGQVTFQQNVAIQGMTMNINSTYSGQSFTPTITYTPLTTNQKGVTWSITSGTSFATINSTTGLVTILSGASSSSITIQAVSIYDSSIIATGTTSITYIEQVIDVTSVTITGADTMSLNGSLTAAILPSNATAQTVAWAVTSGADLVTMSTNGNTANFVVKSSGSITVTATAGGVTATKTITVSDTLSDSSIITFESATTKAFIVDNLDLDNDGEISVAEMKALTHTGTIYKTANINKFNEFKYCTGLYAKNQTGWNSYFNGNTHLTEITLPKNFLCSAYGATTESFKNCTALEYCHFPENFVENTNNTGGYTGIQTQIPDNFFNGCSSMKRVRFPNNITKYGNLVCYNCAALTTVILGTGSTTMQSIVSNTWTGDLVILNPNAVVTYELSYGQPAAANIYVPDALYTQYKNATNWSTVAARFKKLSEYTGAVNLF